MRSSSADSRLPALTDPFTSGLRNTLLTLKCSGKCVSAVQRAASAASINILGVRAEGVWLAGATRYTNRYRNGWTAAAAVARQALDEAKRPGRKQRSASAIPYADMPQPVPVSRFQWPQPQVHGFRYLRGTLLGLHVCPVTAPFSCCTFATLRICVFVAHSSYETYLHSGYRVAGLCKNLRCSSMPVNSHRPGMIVSSSTPAVGCRRPDRRPGALRAVRRLRGVRPRPHRPPALPQPGAAPQRRRCR